MVASPSSQGLPIIDDVKYIIYKNLDLESLINMAKTLEEIGRELLNLADIQINAKREWDIIINNPKIFESQSQLSYFLLSSERT
jgi:hypothetical protein